MKLEREKNRQKRRNLAGESGTIIVDAKDRKTRNWGDLDRKTEKYHEIARENTEKSHRKSGKFKNFRESDNRLKKSDNRLKISVK